jgi:hypothetical protein
VLASTVKQLPLIGISVSSVGVGVGTTGVVLVVLVTGAAVGVGVGAGGAGDGSATVVLFSDMATVMLSTYMMQENRTAIAANGNS